MQCVPMISNPAHIGTRKAKISSVCKEQDDKALIHLSLLGLWHWCSSLWKPTGVWISCSTSLTSHMQTKYWKALQGKHWVLHNVHKEAKHSSVSLIRALEMFQILGTSGQSSASDVVSACILASPTLPCPEEAVLHSGKLSGSEPEDPAPALTLKRHCPSLCLCSLSHKIGASSKITGFQAFYYQLSFTFIFSLMTHSRGLLHTRGRCLLAIVCVQVIKGGRAQELFFKMSFVKMRPRDMRWCICGHVSIFML